MDELRPKIIEAENLLESKFSALIAEWEKEQAVHAAAEEAARRKKQAEYEGQLKKDKQIELVTVDFKPTKGAAAHDPEYDITDPVDDGAGAQMRYSCHGVHFNDANAVVRIEPSSPNALNVHQAQVGMGEGYLRVGDIVIEVAGSPLDGQRVVGCIHDLLAPPSALKLTIARPKYARLDANALPSGEHVGWVYASLAADRGNVSLGSSRAQRYWAALQGDRLLLVAPRDEDASADRLGDVAVHIAKEAAKGANPQLAKIGSNLARTGKNLTKSTDQLLVVGAPAEAAAVTILGGTIAAAAEPGGSIAADGSDAVGGGQRVVRLMGSAVVKPYSTTKATLGKGGEKLTLPNVAQGLIERKLVPFRLQWPDGETEGLELVLAAASANERSGWVKALSKAIKMFRVDGGTSGWLHKRGGRKGGFFAMDTGFKRRWFSLPPKADGDDPHERLITYKDEPASPSINGTLTLNRFTKVIRSPQVYKDQPYCFTVTTQGRADPKPVITVMAAPPPATSLHHLTPSHATSRLLTPAHSCSRHLTPTSLPSHSLLTPFHTFSLLSHLFSRLLTPSHSFSLQVMAATSEDDLTKWTDGIDDAVRCCVYAAEGLATRTIQVCWLHLPSLPPLATWRVPSSPYFPWCHVADARGRSRVDDEDPRRTAGVAALPQRGRRRDDHRKGRARRTRRRRAHARGRGHGGHRRGRSGRARKEDPGRAARARGQGEARGGAADGPVGGGAARAARLPRH